VEIEVERYIKLGLDHLLDLLTYELLTEDQAKDNVITLIAAIHAWTVRHHCSLSNDTVNFIREHLDKATKDPLGHFYLLIKLHKLPISGRPVCSDCGSLPHALGRWVDATLQPIVQDQALYFKNSAKLKTNLKGLTLPPNASLFTYNAIAMYPNINTADCLARLLVYLSDTKVATKYGFSPMALLEAMELVMYNNQMRDLIVNQLSGIAMGMLPAPTIANLYVAIYEHSHVLPYIPRVVLYFCRFINNGLGIRLHDQDPEVNKKNWQEFLACLNNSGLRWVFSERSNEVVFMDLRLKVDGKKITSSLYAKPMALHLYIPPHSCHVPGVLSGLVFGNVLRIHQLCSNGKDVVKEIKLLLHMDRGYQLSKLTPLFQQAMDNAKAY
jgi:hypothetical protein